MNYIDFLDLPTVREEENGLRFEIKSPGYKHHDDWEDVRRGEPRGTIKFNSVLEDRQKLLKSYYMRGYARSIPRLTNSSFERHVLYFRTCLDFWEKFSTSKVFCKDELYVRCLQEGHSFAEYIKKCRSTCLRAMTSETMSDIEDDYFHPEYTGYNSIMHERYLIHWDDTDTIDDVKYAFMPTKRINEKKFRGMVQDLMKDFRIKEVDFLSEIDLLEAMKNTKICDPLKKQSVLMRDIWNGDISLDEPYYARRAVVPTEPGTTRDTGIGTPSTVLKVKILNRLCRNISEVLPYSANTTAKQANARLLRVLKRNAFLHLDFKKFGLTFPRALTNVFIEEIGKVSGLDTTSLIIDNFTVEIDGEAWKTERGTMLGWLDCVNSLCVCAILHNLVKRGFKFDFITFNDDVEISIRSISDPKGTLELLRAAVLTQINQFDIPISINKTYGSLASVFLERYAYYHKYGLDMYKEQLTVKAYAQSCVTKYPWRAKMLFAAAEQWTKSDYARDRCIDTMKCEFHQDEITLPLWAGGWYIPIDSGIDDSLHGSDDRFLALGSRLGLWKQKLYSSRVQEVHSARKINEYVNRKTYEDSSSAALARLTMNMTEVLDDINEEVSNLNNVLLHATLGYHGRDVTFPTKVMDLIEEIEGSINGVT